MKSWGQCHSRSLTYDVTKCHISRNMNINLHCGQKWREVRVWPYPMTFDLDLWPLSWHGVTFTMTSYHYIRDDGWCQLTGSNGVNDLEDEWSLTLTFIWGDPNIYPTIWRYDITIQRRRTAATTQHEPAAVAAANWTALLVLHRRTKSVISPPGQLMPS